MRHFLPFFFSLTALLPVSFFSNPKVSHPSLEQHPSLFPVSTPRMPETAEAWSGLGTGLNGTCLAITIDEQGNLYAGGAFSQAGGVPASNIAMWDGQQWSALGSGLDNDCLALAFDSQGNLYAGGIFENAGGAPASRIARWDGENWSALGAGLDNACRSVAIDAEDNLYAGGIFLNAGGVEASRIAQWDGSNWSSLDRGLAGAVDDLAIDSRGNVYAVGTFTVTPPPNLLLNRVAMWEKDSTRWVALGSGLEGGASNAVAIDAEDNVFVGGGFNLAGGVAANRIAQWDGESFTPLGDGLGDTVQKLKVGPDGNLYAVGFFEESDGSPGNHIARWDGQNWSSLGAGLNALCQAVGTDAQNTVYAGGIFTQAGGMDISRIARFGDEIVAVEEPGEAAYSIRPFPNPTRGEVWLEGLEQEEGLEIQISSISGSVIRYQRLRDNKLNLSDLPQGLYLLSFRQKGRRISVKVEITP